MTSGRAPQPDRQPRPLELLLAVIVLVAIVGGLLVLLHRQGLTPGISTTPARPPEVIDPALLTYKEVERLPAPLQHARGLALNPRGERYLVGDQRLILPDGRPVALEGAPQAIAVAPDGTLYLALERAVAVYSPAGARRAVWEPADDQALFTSIAAGAEDVWVADAGHRVVYRYTRDGKLRGRFGERNERLQVPGLVAPSPHLDVALAPDGQLWIANPGRQRLEAYALDGAITRAWGVAASTIEGFSGCCNPADFAVLPDGRLVTAEKGTPRVKVYSATGHLEAVVAPQSAFAATGDVSVGMDVAAAPDGRIHLLDRQDNTVRIYARKDGTNR